MLDSESYGLETHTDIAGRSLARMDLSYRSNNALPDNHASPHLSNTVGLGALQAGIGHPEGQNGDGNPGLLLS